VCEELDHDGVSTTNFGKDKEGREGVDELSVDDDNGHGGFCLNPTDPI